MPARKRTGAEDAFMNWARARIVARGSAHPLAFLIDWTTGTWHSRLGSRRQNSRDDIAAVQPGHLTSFRSGAPERLALEDADFNQEKNYAIESRRGIVIASAVAIEGIPVESATAHMWDRVGVLRPKGLVNAAPPHPGWSRDDADGAGG